MKEDFSETPLNRSPFKFTYVGKNIFIVLALSLKKKKIEKWPLITSVQCIILKNVGRPTKSIVSRMLLILEH